MSRTYRRRGQRHEYRWVLRDWKRRNFVLVPVLIEARSEEGGAQLRVFIRTPNRPSAAAAPGRRRRPGHVAAGIHGRGECGRRRLGSRRRRASIDF